MLFRHTLIKRDNSEYIIDDPRGWDGTPFKLTRSEEYHGVTFDQQLDDYTYFGEGARLLEAEYDEYGEEGKMKLRIEYKCVESDDWSNVYDKDLDIDFGTYSKLYGDECGVTVGVENATDGQLLENMRQQKVNLETLTSFDGTALPDYDALATPIALPGKSIFVTDKSQQNSDATAPWKEGYYALSRLYEDFYQNLPQCAFFVPGFDAIVASDIGGYTHPGGSFAQSCDEYQLGAIGKWSSSGPTDPYITLNDPMPSGVVKLPYEPLYGLTWWPFITPMPDLTSDIAIQRHFSFFQPDNIPPILNYDGTLGNTFGVLNDFTLRVKFKADFSATDAADSLIFSSCIYLGIRDAGNDWRWLSVDPAEWAVYRGTYANLISPPSGYDPFDYCIEDMTIDKDITISGLTLNPGDRIYLFHQLWFYKRDDLAADTFDVKLYQGNVFDLYGLSKVYGTTAKSFLVNEAWSRIVEAVTNDSMRVYSQYFGRTDSQPYAFEEEGCGSLAAITNGLFIRRLQAVRPDNPPIFSLSHEDMWGGLNPIHNLGIAIEDDPEREGYKCVRIERWDYFYQFDVALSCIGVKNVRRRPIPTNHYNIFKFGYSKWESESFSSIDEFLTNREYRTTNTAYPATLQKTSNFIASGYAIEVTRRKGNSTTEDFKYDNETFIIALAGKAFGIYFVETGGIDSAAKIIDPNTILNWRYRPLYNAMRWAPIVFAAYKNYSDASELIFTKGDGNFYATGKSESDFCKMTDEVLDDKATITPDQFADSSYPDPLWFNEDVTFQYPMTIEEFKDLRSNPNRLIYWETDGQSGYGWIRSVEYLPNTNQATFTLKPKRD